MTMAERKPLMVGVLDDDPEFARSWAALLQAGADAAGVAIESTGVSGSDLEGIVNVLDRRARDFRKKDGGTPDQSNLDDYDVLVIDSDLRDVPAAKLSTGQDLAYAARCFTNVGCIAVLNSRGENPFDLTLKGNWRSFADVHLGAEQLGNPGLWKWPPDPKPRFRPWYWPLLGDEARRMGERVKVLQEEGAMKEPIVEALGFTAADVEAIPRASASFLTAHRKGAARKLSEITFLDFVRNAEHGLQRRDGEFLIDGLDHHRKVAVRVAAARVGQWLNGVLALERDILADGPHVAARYPSQLSEGEHTEALDLSARLDLDLDAKAVSLLPALGFEGTDGPLVTNFFGNATWASRPLWWGRHLPTSKLPEAEEPWTFEPLRHIFLEDESRFAAPEEAREFACNIDTPFRIRYVSRRGTHPEVTYRPEDNFIIDDFR
jgi:hypothetical protein